VEAELVRGARGRALVGALAELGDRDRELVLLRHWDGLTPREIAGVLQVSSVTARARLHRAGRRLERALAAALAGEDLPLTLMTREEPA
jgi:RNA polymerase sigma-70 factor, ECF subfamily